MRGSRRLDGLFAAVSEYASAYQAYRTRGVNSTLNTADREWAGEEPWRVPHYFSVGEDALGLIVAALISTGRSSPQRILDFPSGSGRVTRHLRAFFPDAEIWVSDVYEEHLTFCAEQFGVKTRLSVEDFTSLSFDVEFDLIFCGSLLTHLPLTSARAALGAISRALGPTGMAMVTFHGRHSSHVQRNKWKYVDDELFHVAEDQADATGFGFVEYRGAMRDRFRERSSYGMSLIRPSWAIAQLEADRNVRILGCSERAWDDHQDVVVFGRPGIDD